MSVKELKKELSALSGVDFFNPKYRNVFKKYLPNDFTDSENVDSMEEERLNDVLGLEENQEEKTTDVDETKEDANKEESEKDEITEDGETSDDLEEELNEEDSDLEEETKDTEDPSEETSADENAESEIKTDENLQKDHNNVSQELLEAKVELQLVKSGVREERIESAKKLFMSDIKSIEDLDKLKDLIKQYPEWLKSEKPKAQAFGISMDDNGDGLTEEEKRLKEMGINPRGN